MNNLKQHRHRAIKLLEDEIKSDTVTGFDCLLDDYLRGKFDLPDRPYDNKPYVGWMVGVKENAQEQMKTSQPGIDLIKSHEGLRTKAYMCPANVLTIGYGHTNTVYPGQAITLEEAERLLRIDLIRFEHAVNKYVTVPLKQNQFDALVSFAFNVGITAFANSTLLRFLNNGDYRESANQFDRWVHGSGVRLAGLVRRRKEEKELFLS